LLLVPKDQPRRWKSRPVSISSCFNSVSGKPVMAETVSVDTRPVEPEVPKTW
jgi:hypothetical protein